MRTGRVRPAPISPTDLLQTNLCKAIFASTHDADITAASADTFKAMAHPLRIRLLELLAGTPMTASMLASHTGESTGSTSYHLRQLERHGLIREDTGRGTRRERWWVAAGPQALTPEVLRADPTSARVVGESLIGRWNKQLADFYWAVVEDHVPREIADASGIQRGRLYLTTDEMSRLGDELTDVIRRWRADPAHTDPTRPGAVPVIAQLAVIPDLEELA